LKFSSPKQPNFVKKTSEPGGFWRLGTTGIVVFFKFGLLDREKRARRLAGLILIVVIGFFIFYVVITQFSPR